jgi:lipoprotein-anchoring transpeptidase ErfK/SrfK
MFRGMRVSPTELAVGLTGAAVLVVSIGLVLPSGSGKIAGPRAARPSPAQPAMALRLPSGSAVPTTLGPAKTELATLRQDARAYAGPSELAAGTVPAYWFDRPSVLPVTATRPGWVQVRLAQRPNGATAWVPATDVSLGSTPYRILISLSKTRLYLYNKGRLVFSTPAGVGTADDPTPTGEFFVAFDEHPPQAKVGYGAFVMVTSAHSESIADFEGSGDAVIGIHGPLGEDRQIGTKGAQISHGCVRLHEQALSRLAEVPPGTPIDVVA